MSNEQKTVSPESAKKPGLFKRLFSRLDESMKAKADAKASSDCCCGSGSDKKNGKCC